MGSNTLGTWSSPVVLRISHCTPISHINPMQNLPILPIHIIKSYLPTTYYKHHIITKEEQQRKHQPPYRISPPHIRLRMPFFYHKGVGTRHVGTSVNASRHGVHRGPWRFSFGRFNCFR
ncbi:hypothetical protein GGS20DRAFT_255943 [Poronia punctata]|nr:hypothetical protein GGS20DRAFT_255943 [Poronia punctata]